MKIRSRIWNGDEMTYPDTISNCEKYSILLDGTIFYHDDEESGTEQPDDISLLSTGLKDKNGQEIFDGDVVKSDNGLKWKVIQVESGGFWITNGKEGWQHDWTELYGETDCVKVIGNVHENPELLEE